MYNIQLICPSNIVICGPTGSGKTNIVGNLLTYKDIIFNINPKYVILFYAQPQPIYDEWAKSGLIHEMHQTFPNLDELKQILSSHKKEGTICIFDDLMLMSSNDSSDIFTVIGHHYNCVNIFTSQSLFFDQKHYRTMMLNAHYLFLTKSPRDRSQIIYLGKQISPYNTKYVVDSYFDATVNPYSYIFFDFHQSQSELVRIRSNIFPYQWPVKVYFERKKFDQN